LKCAHQSSPVELRRAGFIGYAAGGVKPA